MCTSRLYSLVLLLILTNLLFTGVARANKATLPSIDIKAEIEFDGTVPFTAANAVDDNNDGVHVPGEDERADNNVVRSFDAIGYKLFYSVNEFDATNVVISSTLPANLEWDQRLPGACKLQGVTPASSVSADGLTLTCNLGDKLEGTAGILTAIAKTNAIIDNEVIDVGFAVESDQSAPVDSNQLTTYGSAKSKWDLEKHDPEVIEDVVRNGVNGVVVIYPITLRQLGLTGKGSSMEPLDNAPILFEDHVFAFPVGVDLATAAETAGRNVCGGYDGVEDFPYGDSAAAGSGASNTTAGALAAEAITCAADATQTMALGYPVYDITIADHDTNITTAPADLASGSPNGPKYSVSMQLAFWVGEDDFIDYTDDNIDVGNAISKDGTANPIVRSAVSGDAPTGIEAIELPVDAGVVDAETSIGNNYVWATAEFTEPPATPPNIQTIRLHHARFDPGRYYEITYQDPINGDIRRYKDQRRTDKGGTDRVGFATTDPANYSNRYYWDGRGEVPRTQLTTLNFQTTGYTHFVKFDELLAADVGTYEKYLNMCGYIDDRYLDILPIAPFDSNEIHFPNFAGDNLGNLTTGLTANRGLAHGFYGNISGILGYYWNPISMYVEHKQGDFVIEFARAADQTQLNFSDPTILGSIGAHELTCNNDDAEGGTWIASTDAAGLAAAFDADGDGVYQGIQRVRMRGLTPIDTRRSSASKDPQFYDTGASIFLQAVVKPDKTGANSAPSGSEIYIGSSRSWTDEPWDAATQNSPNMELNPSNNKSCYGRDKSNYLDNGAALNITPSEWCQLPYDEANEGNADGNQLDGRAAELLRGEIVASLPDPEIPILSHFDRITVMDADTAISKTNVAGPVHFVDNGELITFTIDIALVGSPADVVNNITVADFLPNYLEYVSHTQPANGQCDDFPWLASTRLSCTFGSQNGGFTDSFMITVRVRDRLGGQIIINQATIAADERATKRTAAFANMVPGYSEMTIVKDVPNMLGDCVDSPGLAGSVPDSPVAGDCSLFQKDNSISFQLTYENTGNLLITKTDIIDVLPFDLDSPVVTALGDFEEIQTPMSGTPTTTELMGNTGDGRAPASDYDGTLEILNISDSCDTTPQPSYESANPETISRDPYDTVNDYAETMATATAFAVAPNVTLRPQDKCIVYVLLKTNGNSHADIYTNTFGAAYTASNGDSLPMRSNDVSAMVLDAVSIGSYVWEDTDFDGLQTAGEPPIVGATVTLWVDDGTGNFIAATDVSGSPVASVVTGMDGLYVFGGLPSGDYKVQVTPPMGYEPTTTQVALDNDDTENDSNIASEPTAGTYESGVFTLVFGTEPSETDAEMGDTQDGTTQGTQGNLVDMSGNMTVDFGFIQPVEIGGFIWSDLDGDGQQGANEPPIPGSTVTLLDSNGMPVVDASGNPVPPVVVGLDGQYVFEGLLPGDYKVQVTKPVGYEPTPMQTGMNDDDSEGDSNIASEPAVDVYESGVFTVTPGGEPVETGSYVGDNQDDADIDGSGNMTLDFGFVQTASIGDTVWLDLDQDGVQDASESGIANVTVNLYADTDGDGIISGAELTTPVATAMTGPNGEYLFPDLTPGVVYQVGVDSTTVGNGLVQTYDEGDGLGASDHLSDPIILDPSEEHLTADFGYAPPPGGAIGDTIWIDSDGDGVQDLGEQGIAGVTVTLTPDPTVDLGNGPGVPITTVTDANGNYLFPGLPNDGVYLVTVDATTLPAGYTAHPNGDPDVRSGNDTVADNESVVTLTPANPINLDMDFGYLPPDDQNNSVGDTIWLDQDGDGTQNGTEPGIAGVTVQLIDAATGNVVGTTVTDANGNYLFTGVPDGVYDVVVTDATNELAGLTQTADADGTATPNVSTVDLDSAGTSSTPVEDLDQDFGYEPPATIGGDGVIGDTVFFDSNNDGLPDAGEGIQGVVVELFDANGNLIASTVTDANGNYLFTGLDTSATGETYSVVVDTSTLPNGGAGWSNTVDPDGSNDSTSVVTLTDAAPENLDQDFGYLGDDNNTISGTVWSDTDGDGQQVESGNFAGVTIELLDANGNVIATTVTDANGDYSFTGLPDGMYTVVVTDDNNVLASYGHTDSPNGVSDTGDSTSKDDTGYVVDLDSSGSSSTPVTNPTSDFGYMPIVTNPISLASFKAERSGNQVSIRWTTQTEVGNLGFFLYAKNENEWDQLNADLISGKGDSTRVQAYTAEFTTQAEYFAISDIDLYGKETVHGPFKIGMKHGTEVERKPIDWTKTSSKVSSEVSQSAIEKSHLVIGREALKRQQMLNRNAVQQQGGQ